jgi:hypothetical protein
MRLTWRDWTATILVAASALMYAVWRSEGEVLGISSPRALGLIVLLLGLAASVTAVVFGVGEGLLRANKLYLAVTSLIGLVALVAGIIVLVNESESMLATLVISTAVLWLISTVRHALLGRAARRPTPSMGAAAG